MNSNLGIIISREFKERVAKKSFIVTTLLGPLLMVILMAAPALIMNFSTPSNKTIAVIDDSGIIYPALLKASGSEDYLSIVEEKGSLKDAIDNEKFDGVLTVGADIIENPDNATLYTHESGSINMESLFVNVINKTVEDERLRRYNIENLDHIMDEVKVDANLSTKRIDDSGEEKEISSGISFMLGIVMTFILYFFLLMYGQMVMTSIIEEKNNRVLELVVSSVKPTQLMLGKILGVGLVAVVQIVIWGILVCAMSAYVMPLLIPESVSSQMSMFNAGTINADALTVDPEILRALSIFSSVGYIVKIFFYLVLFLIGGFLFYASIFAAIGSSVDNVQDASQLQTFAILPIMVAFIFSMSVGTDPNTQAAVWLSIIPFTSPMVMLARIPFDIPGWQIWTSIVVLYVSFVVMAWIAGKIYRVGIFMYGKKPTIKDLIRWARYK